LSPTQEEDRVLEDVDIESEQENEVNKYIDRRSKYLHRKINTCIERMHTKEGRSLTRFANILPQYTKISPNCWQFIDLCSDSEKYVAMKDGSTFAISFSIAVYCKTVTGLS